MPNVSALFVRKDSIYKKLLKDTFDIERNALNFTGENSIVAHPPCRAWGQLNYFSKHTPEEKNLALWTIEKIRLNGGILEHPRASRLWPFYLPYPGYIDIYGGFSISIDQFWFGHKAKKTTLLYIKGCNPLDIPQHSINFNRIEHVISTSKRTNNLKKSVSKKEREATPEDLAKFMIDIAQICYNNLHNIQFFVDRYFYKPKTTYPLTEVFNIPLNKLKV